MGSVGSVGSREVIWDLCCQWDSWDRGRFRGSVWGRWGHRCHWGQVRTFGVIVVSGVSGMGVGSCEVTGVTGAVGVTGVIGSRSQLSRCDSASGTPSVPSHLFLSAPTRRHGVGLTRTPPSHSVKQVLSADRCRFVLFLPSWSPAPSSPSRPVSPSLPILWAGGGGKPTAPRRGHRRAHNFRWVLLTLYSTLTNSHHTPGVLSPSCDTHS